MYKSNLLIILIVALVVSLAGLLVLNLNPTQQANLPQNIASLSDSSLIEASINNSKLNLEVARSSQKREDGLMNRLNLEENSGMFFIFEDEQPRTFWMKDTPLSLDIIFLDKDLKIVRIFEKTKPAQTDEVYSSIVPSQYVIEANSGWGKKHNVKVDDRLIISSTK